jgi:hypothetical protein
MEWSGIGVMAEATMEEGSRLGLGVLLVQCCKPATEVGVRWCREGTRLPRRWRERTARMEALRGTRREPDAVAGYPSWLAVAGSSEERTGWGSGVAM